MAGIEIEFDAKSFAADADKLTRVDLPAVFRSAMRSAANPIQRKLGQTLADRLDNPVPFSKRGFYVEVSNAAEPQMEIGVRPMQASYLQYAFEGGTESGKVVPTEHTPLDAYGNIPRNFTKLAVASGAFWLTAHSGVRTLFHRNAGQLEALAMVLHDVDYEKQIDFESEAAIAVGDLLPGKLTQKLAAALRSGGTPTV